EAPLCIRCAASSETSESPAYTTSDVASVSGALPAFSAELSLLTVSPELVIALLSSAPPLLPLLPLPMLPLSTLVVASFPALLLLLLLSAASLLLDLLVLLLAVVLPPSDAAVDPLVGFFVAAASCLED